MTHVQTSKSVHARRDGLGITSGDSPSNWFETAISEANKDVAKYQERIDSATDKAREELSQEFGPQIEALQAEIASIAQERDQAYARIDKLGVAVLMGVPIQNAPDFASLLTGSNPDEYKASAERLLALFKRV